MSEAQYEEEVSNPYNARKAWHTPDTPKMGDADGLFYAESQATPEEAPEEEAQPRKRTNYKKRYDDLKKHYDQKLAEFKQTEQELRAEAMQAQPAYSPPKSEEELESFRQEYPDLYNTVETVALILKISEVMRTSMNGQRINQSKYRIGFIKIQIM